MIFSDHFGVEVHGIDNFFNALKIVQTRNSLVRVGSENDGGYIVPLELFQNMNFLFSIGIGNDINFETEAALKYGLEVHCYDPYVDYTGDHEGLTFHKKAYHEVDLRNLNTGCGTSVVKIDIEGGEWEYRQDLRSYDIIIMEMHLFAVNYNESHSPYFTQLYEKLYKKTNEGLFARYYSVLVGLLEAHSIIHIHGNNSLPKVTVGGYTFPPLIELTFVKNNYIKSKFQTFSRRKIIPPEIIPADRPNKTDRPDFDSIYPFKTK